MADKESGMKIGVRAEGTDKASKDLKSVADAQQEVTGKVGASATQSAAASEATKKLTASESDYLETLRRINPAIGDMADVMFKGLKIVGSLGAKSISLTGILRRLTGVVKANAEALKMLGAATVAGLGFMALAKAISYVRSESEKLRMELEALKAEKTTEQEEVIAGQRKITRIARGRREGGFAAEEEAEAHRIYKAIVDVGRVEDLDAAKNNIASLVGLFTGPEIEKLTLGGVTIDVAAREGVREARARRALESEQIAERETRERERVRAARSRSGVEARREVRSDDPLQGLAYFNEITSAAAAGLESKVVEDVVRRAMKLRDLYAEAEEEYERTGKPTGLMLKRPLREAADEGRLPDELVKQAAEHFSFAKLGWIGGPSELEKDAAARIIRRLDSYTTANAGPQTVIHDHRQFNCKNVGPDSRSRQRATVNGETRGRHIER